MVHCPRTTVRDIIHLYQREGSVDAKRLGKCGRRRLLSQRDERNIGRRSAANPRATAKEVQEEVGEQLLQFPFQLLKEPSNVKVGVHTVLGKAPALNKAQMDVD
jgi:hypothetical protein